MNDMPSPAPASPAPPPPAEPRARRRYPFHSRKALIASVIVGVLILLAVIAALPVGGDNLWHRAYAVWQLRGMQVAEGFDASVEPQSFGLTGLTPYVVEGVKEGETLGDYAYASGVTAAVLRTAAGDPGQVYFLGKERRALTDSDGAKALVDISPDGNFVAFSVATSSDTLPTTLSGWELHLYNLSEGTDVNLGTGIGAQFFERDGKIWLLSTNPEGLSVTDVESMKGFTTTTFEFLDDISFIARISPDGQHIALRNSANNQFGLYEIYRLDSNVPMGIRPLSADLSSFADVALAEGGLYGATFPDSEQEVEIQAVSYDDESQGGTLYSFPTDAPYRFME